MDTKMLNNRFVKTRIISARSLQISMGAPPLVSADQRKPREVALKEFDEDVLPITAKIQEPRKLEI